MSNSKHHSIAAFAALILAVALWLPAVAPAPAAPVLAVTGAPVLA